MSGTPESVQLWEDSSVRSFIPIGCRRELQSEIRGGRVPRSGHTGELMLTENTAVKTRQPGPEGEVGLNT